MSGRKGMHIGVLHRRTLYFCDTCGRSFFLIGRVRYDTPPSCTHVGTGLVGQKRTRMRSARQS